jgi:hypothetical protein
MTKEEKELIRRYGIVMSRKSEFTYKGFRYDHLRDALNYAKSETNREASVEDPAD